MTHDIPVFKVGPLDEDGTHLYVPVTADPVLNVTDATTDVDGVRQIIAQFPDGNYVCSPDLADAAKELGLPSAPLSAIDEGTRVAIAMSIAQAPDLDRIRDPWATLILMEGVLAFLRGAGAKRWPVRLAMDIELRGDRQGWWYGVLTRVPHPGVVLFHHAADAKQCALLAADDQPAFWAAHPHLRIQLEPGPDFVMKWMRDLYGQDVDVMPRLSKRTLDNEPALAEEEDAMILGGVLSTLALVEKVNEITHTTTSTDDREVRTFIHAGSPWPFVDVDIE